MADFCKQCSEELFGKDFQDLAHITTSNDKAKNMFAVVLCEGCGSIQVDVDGSCISEDCMKTDGKKHHPNYGMVER